MRRTALALTLCLVAAPAFATCKSDADDKKLAGAALKSFMTKCEKDSENGLRQASRRPEARRCSQEQLHQEMHDRCGRHMNAAGARPSAGPTA